MNDFKTNRPDQCDKIVAIIWKYKLNKRLLAKAMDIDNGHFSEKLNLKRGNKFTPSQKEKLTAIIKNIGVELSKIN